MPANAALDQVTILVTRPADQADTLIKRLQQSGASVLHQPAIAISAVTPSADVISSNYDWIIFISKNAVRYGLQYLHIEPKKTQLAAIGKATQQTLADNGFSTIFSPKQGFTSEDLLATDTFSEAQINNKSILIIRGGAGREHLKQQLQQRHAKVDYLDVYQRQVAEKALTDEQILSADIITISSQQGLENLIEMLDPLTVKSMFDKLLIVPGTRCQQKATELGFKQVETAANATDDAMLNCIIEKI